MAKSSKTCETKVKMTAGARSGQGRLQKTQNAAADRKGGK